MLDTLKFVQGAIAKKDLVPELTHFRIEGGLVKGYNGRLALCAPVDMDLDVTPKATPFVKAIQTCTETIQLNMTPNGKLSVKSGNFRALVDCLPEEAYPNLEPEGEWYQLDFELVEVLKKLAPFISEDASRPWSRGVLLQGHSAYATNNVIVVEHWLPDACPITVNIPRAAVQEIVRIGEDPVGIQVADNSITFHYEGDRWMRGQLLDLAWPDLSPILEVPNNPEPLPEGLFETLATLDPFVGLSGALYFLEEGVSTAPNTEEGAVQYLEGLPALGAYNHKQLALVGLVANRVDWTLYPRPCLFYGEGLRGAIIGIRT